MSFQRILIANRGEIAIRIAKAASDLGIKTLAVYSEDDINSLHIKIADEARMLDGTGVPSYLNAENIMQIASSSGCDAIHPGYGFLAENPDFAKACQNRGITFIGPNIEHLALFGNKNVAKQAAVDAGVPVIQGIDRGATFDEVVEFFDSLPENKGVMLKAVAGGGGRGSRAVLKREDLERSFRRCKSEAKRSFGNDDIYVEDFLARTRHIEVQIVGDNDGDVVHLWDRECSVQRRFQKLVEIAPAPNMPKELRLRIIDSAMRLAENVGYSNVGTFEFLVHSDRSGEEEPFVFIEANARLQVEHTVTEEVTGIDIVQTQIQIAEGASISDLGIRVKSTPPPVGFAIQTRVNMETLTSVGNIRPSSGELEAYDPPSGPGVRTDGCGYTTYTPNPSFDSLLAKVIVHADSDQISQAVRKSLRALSEFRIEGVQTNISFLRNVLMHEDFQKGRVHTTWVDENIRSLVDTSDHPQNGG